MDRGPGYSFHGAKVLLFFDMAKFDKMTQKFASF